MQRTRAIPVAWLNSGLCPDRPKGWIPINKIKFQIVVSYWCSVYCTYGFILSLHKAWSSVYWIFRQCEIPYGTMRFKCIQVSVADLSCWRPSKCFPRRSDVILSYGLSNSTWEVFIPWQWELVRHHEPIAYDEKKFVHYMNKRDRRIMKAEPPCDLRISTTGI
jgi:hypothetical protein